MPIPPLPVPRAVITVPAVTPVPATGLPIAIVPDATAVTVNVVPLIEPVKAAGEGNHVAVPLPPCKFKPNNKFPLKVVAAVVFAA